MKINEETTVSEEQVLFNKLRYEDQELIIKIMKSLQPCELSCEIEEEKKIPEKLNMTYMKKIDDDAFISERFSQAEQKIIDTLNGVIDYLKSKGEK